MTNKLKKEHKNHPQPLPQTEQQQQTTHENRHLNRSTDDIMTSSLSDTEKHGTSPDTVLKGRDFLSTSVKIPRDAEALSALQSNPSDAASDTQRKDRISNEWMLFWGMTGDASRNKPSPLVSTAPSAGQRNQIVENGDSSQTSTKPPSSSLENTPKSQFWKNATTMALQSEPINDRNRTVGEISNESDASDDAEGDEEEDDDNDDDSFEESQPLVPKVASQETEQTDQAVTGDRRLNHSPSNFFESNRDFPSFDELENTQNMQVFLHDIDDNQIKVHGSYISQTASVDSDGTLSMLSLSTPNVQIKQRSTSEDFLCKSPLPSWDESSIKSFDESLNCYGVVHVRLLRAQRLPCPVGSQVYASVSLPPWQGRVRTEPTNSFLQSMKCGVCVQWDPVSDSGLCKMINSWSSEESPIPFINIALMFSPLGMGVFEMSMCSLTLSCKELMTYPGIWKSQWCQASVAPLQTESGREYLADNRIPLIQVEAMFVPTVIRDRDDYFSEGDNSVAELDPSNTPRPIAVGNESIDSGREGLTESVCERTVATVSTTKPHLLRVLSFWIPAYCSVCSTIMMGRNRGFHCEACDVHCCSDCRLHVDVQLPCGSDEARAAVEKSFQGQLTLNNIMSIVAPVADTTVKRNRLDSNASLKERPIPFTPERRRIESDDLEPGIGLLKLEFVKACLFKTPFPADAEPITFTGDVDKQLLRQGDYYARVSFFGSKKTARTRTVQRSGMPRFDSEELRFIVPHYGMEYRIDLVDACTDISVGSGLLTSQGILQEQRDLIVAEKGISPFGIFRGPIRFEGKRSVRLELRTGMKTGFSTDLAKTSRDAPSSATTKTNTGEITGWVEILVGLEEDIRRLYGKNPIECPPRPPVELKMNHFQDHVARIKALLDDIKNCGEQFQYMISWKNPEVTFISLIVFVALCLRFNAEYSGSFPFLLLLAYMVYLAMDRKRGGIKNRFVRKEIEASRMTSKVSVDYDLHRPVGIVDVGVSRGKNIRSRDLGLPGRTGCRIYWDPVRYCDEKSKKATIVADKAASSNHDIGFTNTHYSADPVWNELTGSALSRRLKQLALSQDDAIDAPSSSNLQFPVLQPFQIVRGNMNESGRYLRGSLKPWVSSPGALVIEVRFQDILNNLPGFNDVLGEVCIPFSDLVKKGEIKAWFRVLEVGTTQYVQVSGEASDPIDSKTGVQDLQAPQIFVSLKWTPSDSSTELKDTEREASFGIQEELIRSSIIARANKIDLVESSIGAINAALGLSGNVQVLQNTVGSVLDVIEGIRNAFSFTDPFKSSVLFALISLVWLFLAVVPTRYIILVAGLAQYSATFVAQYGHMFQWRSKEKSPSSNDETTFSSKESNPRSAKDEKKQPPMVTWILNAIHGLPSDEDLRKTYFWESRRKGARESEKYLAEKRSSRLDRLWNATWYSPVRLRCQKTRLDTSTSERKPVQWEDVFALVHGRRFLWWHSVHDLDNGELPSGRLFLSGHAGLATPSPLEMREFSAEELPLVVSIFGRGKGGQERITLLTPDKDIKERLEDALLGSTIEDD